MADARNIWMTSSAKGWVLKREGVLTPIRVFSDCEKAWKRAKDLARKTGGKAFWQNMAGTRLIESYDPAR